MPGKMLPPASAFNLEEVSRLGIKTPSFRFAVLFQQRDARRRFAMSSYIIENGWSEMAFSRRDTIQTSTCTRRKCKQKRVLLDLAVFRHVFNILKSMLLIMQILTIFCSKGGVVMSCHGPYSIRFTVYESVCLQTENAYALVN